MTYSTDILDDVRLLLGNTDSDPGDFSDITIYRAFSHAVRFSDLHVSHGINVTDVTVTGVTLDNTTALSNTLWMLFIWGTVMILLEGWGLINKGVRWRSGLATIDTTRQASVVEGQIQDATRNFWGIVSLIVTYGYDVDLYSLYNDTGRLETN